MPENINCTCPQADSFNSIPRFNINCPVHGLKPIVDPVQKALNKRAEFEDVRKVVAQSFQETDMGGGRCYLVAWAGDIEEIASNLLKQFDIRHR